MKALYIYVWCVHVCPQGDFPGPKESCICHFHTVGTVCCLQTAEGICSSSTVVGMMLLSLKQFEKKENLTLNIELTISTSWSLRAKTQVSRCPLKSSSISYQESSIQAMESTPPPPPPPALEPHSLTPMKCPPRQGVVRINWGNGHEGLLTGQHT